MILVAISLVHPPSFSDRNSFLKDFLDNDLLSTLGFIAAVTLASISHMHLQIGKIEAEKNTSFAATKKSLKLTASSLILLFGIAFCLVVAKPLLPATASYQAAVNIAAILIVYVYLEVLWDITFATFKV